jgi:hypothetical protein
MELWTAFLLGLVGSLHCAGMCGPLALALPVPSIAPTAFVLGRVLYNLGRLGTYCLLGMVFGLLGRTLLVAGLQRGASVALGVILLAGLLASGRLALAQPINRLVAGLKTAMAGWLQQRSLSALAVLGGLTGLLPCGLVYVACAAAATTSSPLGGAQYMAVFGLGTFPMMLALSLSGRLLQPALRTRLQAAIPVSVFLLGCLLILRGLSLGIPYLSPDLGAGSEAGCCHESAHPTRDTSSPAE